mmetsp:Transcript_22545/g.32999  ORF Transcript_22545/g.32999 Transcript_22545/m.32999 type:complete len:172 (-) Transcript_22545:148-663(-)
MSLRTTVTMVLPSLLLRSVATARQPLVKSIAPALTLTLTPTPTPTLPYSTLQRINPGGVKVKAQKTEQDDVNRSQTMQTMLLPHMIRNQQLQVLLQQQQQTVNQIITSIQSIAQKNQGLNGPSPDQQDRTLPILEALNRSARRPKKANHGKRPVSRAARRAKRRANGNHRR